MNNNHIFNNSFHGNHVFFYKHVHVSPIVSFQNFRILNFRIFIILAFFYY